MCRARGLVMLLAAWYYCSIVSRAAAASVSAPHVSSSSSCINASWASFAWRVQVSNLYEYPAGSGANLSLAPVFHSRLAYPDTARSEEKSKSAPKLWGPWWEFTSANATEACTHYPNQDWYQASWTQLVLELEVYGIPLGAGANVTLQIQPRGARAAEPSYEITTRAAHLKIELEWASKAWPNPPNNPSVSLTYILAAEDNVLSRVLETERVANHNYWQMMPAMNSVQPPKQVQVVQGYHGQDDIDGWMEASTAIRRLGANGLRGYPSAGLQTLLQDREKWPFVSTLGNLLAGYGPGLSGSTNVDGQGAMWWGGTEEQLQANITRWAASKLGPFRTAGFKTGLAQVAIHDEPQWHLPANRNGSLGPFGFRFDLPSSVPHYQLQQWKSFLRANNVTLKMLGVTSWNQALPISRYNLSVANDQSSEATALKLRFYWGLRFYSWSAATFYSKVTAALVKEMGQGPLTIYTNYNNFHGRFYTPMIPASMSKRTPSSKPKKKVNPYTVDASGVGHFDWFEAGRLRAGTVLWTEDWFGDEKASEWSYLGARLRSAARLGGPDMSWGGYVVPRGPTGHVARGTPGLTMRALTMVGNGAKGISYFELGPEPMFPGNCYTDYGNVSAEIFKHISHASNMIAKAEHLLFPGRMPASDVAFLFPRSSFAWDVPIQSGNSAESCPHSTESPAGTAMDYAAVLAGMYRMLVQQGNGGLTIDFIDEDEAANLSSLSRFKAIVVTEPAIPVEALSALGEFVKHGGHLLTVTSAGTRDHLNVSSDLLTNVTGFVEEQCNHQIDPLDEHSHTQQCRVQECFQYRGKYQTSSNVANGTGIHGPISAWGLRGFMSKSKLPPGTVIEATFSDGSPAIVQRAVAQGSVTHFSFLPGVHFPGIDPFAAAPGYNNDANYTDGTRPYVENFLAAAGVRRRVELSIKHIEAPLLSSSAGTVVTLLNWGQPLVDEALSVSVVLDHDVSSVRVVNYTRAELQFRSAQVSSKQFGVNFTLGRGVFYHGEFVLLAAK